MRLRWDEPSNKTRQNIQNSDSYVVYVDYISKPNEYQGKGSVAITDAKGLYFY